jgi:hypothetical protein
MVNDLPDPAKFLKVTGDLIAETAKVAKVEPARLAACGECAPLLWAQGKADAAIRLEHLWDEIAKRASFQGGVDSRVFEKISAEHSVVHSG